MSSRSYRLQIMQWHQSLKNIHYKMLLIFQNKKTTDLRVKTWGGIKDMLSPPCQNMGGYITPIPPRIYALDGAPHAGQFLHLLFWGPFIQISFFVYHMGAPSGQFLCLLERALSDQFFSILYGGPLRSISLPTIWGPPGINFFFYYMGAPN